VTFKTWVAEPGEGPGIQDTVQIVFEPCGFTLLRIVFQCERVNFTGLPNHSDRNIKIFSYLITTCCIRAIAENCCPMFYSLCNLGFFV